MLTDEKDVLRLSLVDAIQVVQARRFSANVDDELKLILGSYSDVLEAQRMVAAEPRFGMLGHYSMAVISTPVKRGREVEVDSVMEDEDDDLTRFQGRSGFAPFSDT